MSSPTKKKLDLHVDSCKFYALTFRVLTFKSYGYYTIGLLCLIVKLSATNWRIEKYLGGPV